VQVTENENMEISRVPRSKEAAKSSYDRLSRWYDVLAGGSENRLTKIGLQKLKVKEGEIVLEIGFGTGHALVALTHLVGQSGKVYGIDLSEGMLQVARDRINKAGLLARVELRCGDAVRLPFDADFFDAIFMSFTLELFDTPEIPTVLGECYRVLRDGGRMSVVAMSKKEQLNWPTRLYEWTHKVWPNYVDCRPIPVLQVLQEAGFKVVDSIGLSVWGLPVDVIVVMKQNQV
jgi:demethylmenaquinone methyltransferase/2-methoxy-6-polyprenyl-1,4-benzoquinol methylase